MTIDTCVQPNVHEVALRLLQVPVPSRILEIGCFEGSISVHLAERGHRVTSCDQEARPGTASLPDFLRVDANHVLPYGDAAFDAVISTDVIEHLENPTNLVREAARVLRPGGVFVLSTPHVDNFLARLHFLVRGELPLFRHVHHTEWGHISPITVAWIKWTGDACGLDLERVTSEPLAGGWRRRLVYYLLLPLFQCLRQPGLVDPGTTLVVRLRKRI